MADWLLLPTPRQIEVVGTVKCFTPGIAHLPDGAPRSLVRAFDEARAEFPVQTEKRLLVVSIDRKAMPHPEGYLLTISQEGVSVVAHDYAGIYYSAQTLKQIGYLAVRNRAVPACHIVDWPDFANRGVLIDIARTKVPEMKTLYNLVDMLASWKYNQFQMYTEHAFAHKNHHVVWEDASPITPQQVRDLDAYCRERFVELVPNQNSFGHMNRWLMHPEYAHLAETTDNWAICPIVPDSIELIRDIYSNILPCYSSSLVNVGCDETWTLGKGRSKAACDDRGLGTVYLEFLLQIHEIVRAHGKTMQFWGDIIHFHPEQVPRLPKDVIAMEWGYEAGHQWEERTLRFKDSNVRFYVVPGTSSWNSFLGRTENGLANMREAAEVGVKNGAEGYLNTDWGDGGHWQFEPVSYLPFAYGAGVSWCVDTNRDIDIARAADRYAFRDDAGVMGKFAYDIGNSFNKTPVRIINNTTLFVMLQSGLEQPLSEAGMGDVEANELDSISAAIDEALARLDDACMDREDAALIKAEYRLNAAMAKLACGIGIARVNAGGIPTSQLPRKLRHQFAAQLKPLIPEYRQLWLARNRSGGLKESAGMFENILSLLSAP